MVQKINKKEITLYDCGECNLLYKEQEWAEKCEAFCIKYHMCSLEITKYAIQPD